MIRLRNEHLSWDECDLDALASLIGADAATAMRCPYWSALLRAASKRRHLTLDAASTHRLRVERRIRKRAKPFMNLLNAPAQHPLERALMPHQRGALAFFRQTKLDSYLVADETGVGKTLEALLWAHGILHAQRVLIVTKNIAKDQWRDAIHQWIKPTERVRSVEGTLLEQSDLIYHTERDGVRWTLAHWESLANVPTYRQVRWDAIIADEAHLMANPDSYRSQLMFRLKAPYRMALTAHPFSSHPGELFSILRFLWPRTYTSYWRFFWFHVRATPQPFGGFDIAEDAARRPRTLAWELAPFMIRREKNRVYKTLPKIARVRRTVQLSAQGRKEYERLRRQAFAEIEALDRGPKYVAILNDLVRVTRMRQYLIDPRLIGGRLASLKYPAVLEIMDEVGKPVVIFTAYEQAAQALTTFLARHKKRTAMIAGPVKPAARREHKRLFLADKLDALIVVADSGDTALNLGRHGYVLHLDLPWTPRGLEQAEGRVDRPEEGTGKLVPTTAFRIIVSDSYEERMETRLTTKSATFGEVFRHNELEALFQ